MGWVADKAEKFRKWPLWLMIVHVTAKFVFGVGVGVLLASYFQGYNWRCFGWDLIILALVMSIPGVYRVFKK